MKNKRCIFLLVLILLLLSSLCLAACYENPEQKPLTPSQLEYEYSQEYEGYIAVAPKDKFISELVMPEFYDGKPVVGMAPNFLLDCSQILTMYISKSIKFIDTVGFIRLSNLRSVTVDKSNADFSSIDGILYNKTQTEIILVPKKINNAVTIPSSIKTIDGYHFAYTSVTDITLSEGIERIDGGAFDHCPIKTIHLPASLTTLDAKAFSGCETLETVTVSKQNAHFSLYKNILYNKDQTEIVYVPNTVKGKVTLSENLKILPRACFSGKEITSINLPNGLTDIGAAAFSGCATLTDIVIPNSVTSIGNNAFFECTSLTDVDIPNSVDYLGSSAFAGCAKFTRVRIPNKITELNDGVFAGCSNLVSIDFNNTQSIGSYCFGNCTKLESVNLSDKTTAIDDLAFFGCVNLYRLDLPNTLKSIGKDAFGSCENLTTICFNGTIEQWNGITNNKFWLADTNKVEYITCTNGSVTK